MPLVPELFPSLTLMMKNIFFFRPSPVAKAWGRFWPNLDIPQYRESLSEEKKAELDKRAGKLSKRAIGHQLYKSSEFSWEVCAWHDVFGPILDDVTLRMWVFLFSFWPALFLASLTLA